MVKDKAETADVVALAVEWPPAPEKASRERGMAGLTSSVDAEGGDDALDIPAAKVEERHMCVAPSMVPDAPTLAVKVARGVGVERQSPCTEDAL